VNPRRKNRQIVVRLPADLETELENAVARYGSPYGLLVRASLRRFLRELTEEDIQAELKDDQRRRNTAKRQRARMRLEEIRRVRAEL